MSKNDGTKAPKSNAERQAAYRAKKTANKMQEIRGIFATVENSRKIKEFAQSINQKGENHEN
jgi:hypothetical protein